MLVFWVATVYWVYKDARRRDRGPAARLGLDRARRDPVPRAAHLHALPPAGVPRRRARARARDPARWRSGSAAATSHCPVCRADVDDDFLVCPVCTTRLRQACTSCGKPLEPRVAGLPVLRDAGRRPTRRRVSRAAASGARTRTPQRAARLTCAPHGRRTHTDPRKAGRRRAQSRRRDPRALRAARPEAARRALVTASRELGETHYAEHKEKPFFGELVDFITSGPTLAFVLEGEGAIATCRKTIGATNPADADPGSLRGASRSRCRTTSCTAPTRPSRPSARSGSGSPMASALTTRRAKNAATWTRPTPSTPTRTPSDNWALGDDPLGRLGGRRVRAERPRRRRGPRRRRARLRHRVLLRLAREARRAARRRRHHARAARDGAPHDGGDRHRVPARRGGRRRDRAARTRASTSSSREYGASIWVDPYRWIPEAARLLRPGGRLVFLRNSTLVDPLLATTTGPSRDAAAPAVRDAPHRVARRAASSSTSPHGEWIDLLRANGFEIERLIEIQAPADAETHAYYAYVTAEWAKQVAVGGDLGGAQR